MYEEVKIKMMYELVKVNDFLNVWIEDVKNYGNIYIF